MSSTINISTIKYSVLNLGSDILRNFPFIKKRVLIYLEHTQYFPLIEPLIRKRSDLFKIYTLQDEVTEFLKKKNIEYLKKVKYCDAIIFLCNYTEKDDLGSLNKFFFNRSVKKVQLFHGVTDGLDGYTYESTLKKYDLIFCCSEYRLKNFLQKSFSPNKL